MSRQRVLFVTPECEGLIQVGGLADISASLPRALARLGHDVRLLLPMYRGLDADLRRRAAIRARLPDGAVLREWREGPVPVWLFDAPGFARREHPYQRPDGSPWPEDALDCNAWARAAAWLAGGRLGLDWRADIVHCNDWMTGLVPVWMQLERVAAASVFTIHNLAHQGLFEPAALARAGLPDWLFHPEALEYFGRWSLIKGGLNFADRLTTVSPTYAREIQTPAVGEGLDGLLRRRSAVLTGILNGIEPADWNPRHDAALPANYYPGSLKGKRLCSTALRYEFDLPADDTVPLAAFVGRLVGQKGAELLLAALPQLLSEPFQLVVVGVGEAALETAFRQAAAAWPDRLVYRSVHDPALARRVYAGAELFLMPSRFEPCGLAQMYAMRYGAVPVAHAVGGLRDTIVPLAASAEQAGEATGFLFRHYTVDALVAAVTRAGRAREQAKLWNDLMRNGMRSRFDWRERAVDYEQVYVEARRRLQRGGEAPRQ